MVSERGDCGREPGSPGGGVVDSESTSTTPPERHSSNLPLRLWSGVWDITESKLGVQVRSYPGSGGEFFFLMQSRPGLCLKEDGTWDFSLDSPVKKFPTLDAAVQGWREAGGE